MSGIGADDVLAIFAAYALAAVVKGVIGLGTPLVVVPLLSTRLGLPTTIGLLIVPMFLSNAIQAWQYRIERHHVPFLPAFVVTAGLGIGFGTWGLIWLDPEPLKLIIGVAVLVYLALSITVPNLSLSPRASFRLAPFVGIATGFLQGLSGISAPISLTYLSALHLSRARFIFTISTLFMSYSVFQFISLATAGVMTGALFAWSALATVPTLLFMPIGTRIGRRFSAAGFRYAVLALLFLLALRMIWQGLSQ